MFYNRILLTIILSVTVLQTASAQNYNLYTSRQRVKIKPFNDSTVVIFDMDSVKYYIGRKEIMRYLKKKIDESSDRDNRALFGILKRTTDSVFYLRDSIVADEKTGHANWNVPQSNYAHSLHWALPYLLFKKKVRVFDVRNRRFANEIIIVKHYINHILSSTEMYYPDGKMFYDEVLMIID